jgi:hypothetical protein
MISSRGSARASTASTRRPCGDTSSGSVPLAEVEGQIVELCRDLSLQAKRMRQLQEQADELKMLIRQWTGRAGQ